MKKPFKRQLVDNIETPALLLDLNQFEANIRKLAAYCHEHGKRWRPHSKANKSPAIARQLLANGASGITCAKVSEAELMAAHGIESILIANQIVSPGKMELLASLQAQTEVIAAIDNQAMVGMMGAAARKVGADIPLVIELDIGMDRVGIAPGAAALDLARAISDEPGLLFKGLMGYEGHVLELTPPAAKEQACHKALTALVDTRDLLEDHGFEVEIVSAGGTGSYEISARYDGLTELQAGGGIFMDLMYRDTCNVSSLEPALTVLATVTSRASDRVVVDSGFKTLSSYHHAPEVLHRNDLTLRYLSAEHGVFDIVPGQDGPALGEKIELLVGYSDSTTMLHEDFVGIRDGRVEELFAISARGLVR